MFYIAGIITGLILSVVLLALEAVSSARHSCTLSDSVKRKVEAIARQRAIIMTPKGGLAEAQEKIIKRNARRGANTRVDEL